MRDKPCQVRRNQARVSSSSSDTLSDRDISPLTAGHQCPWPSQFGGRGSRFLDCEFCEGQLCNGGTSSRPSSPHSFSAVLVALRSPTTRVPLERRHGSPSRVARPAPRHRSRVPSRVCVRSEEILSDESTGILSALAGTELPALAAGTGALTTGGIYAAFPTMVLPALDQLRPGGAIEVMRAINVAAERPRARGALVLRLELDGEWAIRQAKVTRP